MLQTALSQTTTLLTCAACTWSWVRGRWPERVGAAVIVADWIGGAVFQDHRWYHHGQPVNFALDVVMFATLLYLVIQTRRVWVLWAAACALLLVLTHVVMMIDVSLYQWSFWTALYVWSLGVVAALAAGASIEGPHPVRVRLTDGRPPTPNARAQTRS